METLSAWVPQELCDHIIDYLYDDIQALAACSLCCRAWLRRTRRHMFESVTLSNRNVERATQFKSMLEASPVIGRCVRSLLAFGPYTPKPYSTLFLRICCFLPSVHILTLGTPNPSRDMMLPNIDDIKVLLGTIRTLKLLNITWDDAQLSQWLSSTPLLSQLYISSVFIPLTSSPRPDPPLVPATANPGIISLKGLVWSHLATSPSDILPTTSGSCLLGGLIDLSRTEGLDISWQCEDIEAGALANRLTRTATSLKHLVLSTRGNPIRSNPFIDLSHNTDLTSLHLIDNQVREGGGRAELRWMAQALSSVYHNQHRHLQRLKLTLQYSFIGITSDHHCRIEWERVDTEVARLARGCPSFEIWVCISNPYSHHGQWTELAITKVGEYLTKARDAGARVRVTCCRNWIFSDVLETFGGEPDSVLQEYYYLHAVSS
ncbi:hypothetical protein WOLCODRAFT_119492 [Wolfiporia cocos MD-104 SS10]|uniref:F-box domain-containing protein n=1 Tax=Wolfiporia cocos (strain MD-104) TaxID=742152 RepID=A0A2H3JP79_WOLCO|nr:hypothetical protein WOLCODRAFT_119492 [Wolfiporia cocos MD-104 SS10]